MAIAPVQLTSADGAPLARQWARAAMAFAADRLDPEIAAKAKVCLLDFLSCAFEARDLPWSRQAIAIAAPVKRGATVIGTALVSSAGDAAFVNGVLGHGLVREDMHAASIGHHGVVVWPALLALAQRAPVPGASFLAAAVVGYEVGARLGRVLFDTELARLFRPTGITGPIGAAAAGSCLRGLDEPATTSAMALAANTSSGLNHWPHTGGSEMYFHPGFAARNAVTAVDLAAFGAYGSSSIMEGDGGLFAAFRRQPPAELVMPFADGRAEILAVYNKPVPACNFAQTACQVALRLSREVPGAAAITGILARVTEAALRYPGCDAKGPFERPLQAKMSIPFGVAAALAHGTVEEAHYHHLDDPEVLRLMRLVDLRGHDDFTAAYPRVQGAEVELTLADGRRISHRLDDVVPATEGEIRARFHSAAATVLGDARAATLAALVDRLETVDDAGQLGLLCGSSATRSTRRRSAPA